MTIHLKQGAHDRREDGMCVMEAAAYIADEGHSSVSPTITSFLQAWNDGLQNDADRDRLLKPLLLVVLHTRTTAADEETRAWMMLDWLVRVYTPAWLGAAALDEHAAAVRALARIDSVGARRAAASTLDAARVAAEGRCGGSPRGEVAWATAATAGPAAWRAARTSVWGSAGDAMRDTAWATASTAAAGARVRVALAPVVAVLQASACDLVRRLAAVGVQHEPRYSVERYLEVCR